MIINLNNSKVNNSEGVEVEEYEFWKLYLAVIAIVKNNPIEPRELNYLSYAMTLPPSTVLNKRVHSEAMFKLYKQSSSFLTQTSIRLTKKGYLIRSTEFSKRGEVMLAPAMNALKKFVSEHKDKQLNLLIPLKLKK